MDFANFGSQPIIIGICKEFRVEWESVVFFGMNKNVGEGRGECCGVVWCGGVCLHAAQHIPIKGAYTARTHSVRSSLQNMAGEEVAHHVVGNDSGMYKAGIAGDDAPRPVPSDAKHMMVGVDQTDGQFWHFSIL